MLPSAVAKQQAKLGVSTEESKAQRLKRQQSRFRDRGGAFVQSDSNPLVDILLARTVSGESPSKARPKAVAAKRSSPRKSRQTSTRKTAATTVAEKSQTLPRSSKPKARASRKRKANVSQPEDPATKPAPKRRGRPPKVQKKTPVGDDKQPPVPKPNKRKKEDNYDDRPRKTVKISDTGPPHFSSQKLKENQSDTKHKRAAKASVQDEPDATRPKLTIKPPSRSLASKGPPLEVLERIKASAARHLNRADSEPDELDCLS
ncbi:hypothetical protein JVU11DRAFT_11653 [Chiua virens]|nr:hypothetical protein JVU11DRAFT_11653 [Chiua virens]